MHGVQSVDINPETGSMVVNYDAGVHDDFHSVLAKHGEENDLFMLAPPKLSEIDELASRIEAEAEFLSQRSETAKAIVDFFKGMNREIKRATNNSVDLQVLLPLGLAVYAFIELEADMATPLWVTLGIFSFNSFVALHHPVHPTVAVEKESVETLLPGATPKRTTRSKKVIRKGGL